MRITNTIRNCIYGMLSYAILVFLGLLIRKAFLCSLPIEILGYEGLFSNIFAILSLADLGIESVILFKLFPAFANNSQEQINLIISIYKYLYQIVGVTILILGIIIIPFLKNIIVEGDYNWSYVYCIYFIELLVSLSTYFLAYKRILFKVSQLEYITTKIDTLGSILWGVMKLFSLIILKNFFLFLLCGLLNNLICNFIVSFTAKKTFKYINIFKPTKAQIKNLNLSKDLRNNIVQKVCLVIYGGTDNIIIAALLGINNVGLFANYIMLSGYIYKLLEKILNPFQMSIGNYIHSDNSEEKNRLFRMFDFVSFLIACVTVNCFFCLLNPTIFILFGNKFLLDQYFISAFCLNQYIGLNHYFLCYYRNALGRYEIDRNFIVFATMLNIICSILFAKHWGMFGIMLGTAIGHIGFWLGRMRVVYKLYLDEKVYHYIIRQFFRFIIFFSEIMISFYICRNIDLSYMGLFVRFVVAVFIPCIINLILFFRTGEMKSIFEYTLKVICLFLNFFNNIRKKL